VVCDERKNGIASKFQKDLKNVNPNGRMLQEGIQSACNFSFFKIVEIEFANMVQSFFPTRDVFSACKTLLSISITSSIGMERTKAYLVDMGLSNMPQFSFIF
jgi:hypothetical protein